MDSKKPLHMAESLADLQKQCEAETNNLIKRTAPQVIRKALSKVVQDAELRFLDGDEEKAFFLYYRYIILALKNTTRSVEEGGNISDALSKCEVLKTSLRTRYEGKRIATLTKEAPSSKPKNVSPSQNGATTKPKLPPTTSNGLSNDIGGGSGLTNGFIENGVGGSKEEPGVKIPDINGIGDGLINLKLQPKAVDRTISAKDLRELLNSDKVLLMDCRSAEAFENSRITYRCIINIPKAKVFPGAAAHYIGSNILSGEDKSLFDRRKSFDKVVLIDWEGDSHNVIYSTLNIVEEAVTKWAAVEDSVTCIRLQHGYKFWCNAYPHDTTNSKPNITLNETAENAGEHQVELKNLNWQPSAFEKVVPVLPVSDPTPLAVDKSLKPGDLTTDTQNTPTVPPPGATVPSRDSKPKIEPSTVSANPKSEVKVSFGEGSAKPSGEQKDAKSASSAVRPLRDEKVTGVENGTGLSEVEKNSAATVKQFADSVNEQIMTTPKPRTRSETNGSPRLPLLTTNNIKPEMARSLSLSDIYEESPGRDVFEAGGQHDDRPEARKRPSIDRTLKPSGSLDTATVHQRTSIGEVVHADRRIITNGRPSIPPKSAAHRRSRSPVQAYRTGIDRTAGLRNLGNTCYMNSVLQALAHSADFAQFFVRKQYEMNLNLDNPRGTRGNLPLMFANLISDMWSQGDARDRLVSFRNLMGTLYSMYGSYEQQDSHEFLVNLLDKLHEDLNRAPQRNMKNGSDNSDLVVTFDMLPRELNKFFNQHVDMHDSTVTKNYEGILVSGLKCLTCERDSYTFQVFNVLSVPIPGFTDVDILDCFDEFFKEEKVSEWMCPHCKQKRNASKHMRIARLPKHLIIHLVRFKNESWTSFSFSNFKKITNVVHFTDVLDTRELAQYVYSKDIMLKSYSLYSVVNHYGTISSGHYFSDCRFLPKEPWYRYNDQVVSAIQNRPEVANAYMLFYTCVDA